MPGVGGPGAAPVGDVSSDVLGSSWVLIPLGLVVLHSDVPGDTAYRSRLCADLVQLVRDQIGTVTGIRQVDVVDALPKTRSGKILRQTMSSIADGKDPVVPATIEDVSVLDAIRAVLNPEPTLASTRSRARATMG